MSASTAPANDVIIRSKILAPERCARRLRRPRVDRTLRVLLDGRRIVTVCASPGSGKTTAVADALDGLDRPIAWLSLDGSETPAARLLVYLEAAVGQHAAAATSVTRDALSRGLHIAEAAGLLAESLEGSRLVVVCDNVEQVSGDADAETVLTAFARYLPDGVDLVLVSGIDVALKAQAVPRSRIARLGDEDLAFDVDEATAALCLAGRTAVDVREALAATNGWVTGVLLGPWTGGDDPPTTGLHDFLTSSVLDVLDQTRRNFLLHTSILDEVTVSGAIALGEKNAWRTMRRLRAVHLPVTWSPDGTRMTPHGVFREFLLDVMSRDDPDLHAMLRRRHATFLLDQGEHEEAVDTLLEIGDIDNAWDRAAKLLPEVVARRDFVTAARWLDRLRLSSRCPTPQVGAVVLRVVFALESFHRAAEMFDRFGYQWLLDPTSPDFEESLVLASWCLFHLGRIEDAEDLASHLPPGRARSIALAVIGLAKEEAPDLPELTATPSGPLDGILVRCRHLRGRQSGLGEPESGDPWRDVIGAPWVLAGLRATGMIDAAMSMYEQRRASDQPLRLHAFDAVDLMLDLGRGDEAWESLRKGRQLIAESGSCVYRTWSPIMEAKLWLRLHHDVEKAERALDAAETAGPATYAFARETAQVWRGLCLLMRDRNVEAQHTLLRCVASMQAGDRMLELATAAVYLAEAHWRVGEEALSDEAARLALEVSTAHGLQHVLLAALTDVPDVATRAADASPAHMSPWWEIVSSLATTEVLRVPARRPRVILEEFGEPSLSVDGVVLQPGLTKSIELMSFLLGSPQNSATRRQILDAVFEGRNDAASRSYLRQALFKLRAALPAELAPIQDGELFFIPVGDAVVGTARTMLDLLGLAARQPDLERLNTLESALEHPARGPYLSTISTEWVTARRARLADRVASARIDAARIAYHSSRYALARSLLQEVLREHPYRERAWQLAISVAHAAGSDDDVLTIFRRYTATMRELGVPPKAEVQRLVANLRR
ncbi:BTAD domain-containing putative transcriptional regulator [Pseudonocardia sp. N23]|uniref:BTAD domain-containing putative transcriptional regulator n=1 Tax=Pseudonocardia sp. N23 TaxID=1987376 RepID=UPI000BFC92B8|nr:BTAD domain-containing putative transcriptional regulator [Pseudonocardia sp. N23]GAY07676.1 transcriptional regulator [Pseudonocardia sp. N23]